MTTERQDKGSEPTAEKVLAGLLRAVDRGAGDDGAPVVLAAWVDADDAVSVVYESPFWSGGLLGLRRTFPPHFIDDDPESTGVGMRADIGEPLGVTRDRLRFDRDGVGWWGNLAEDKPGARPGI